MKVSILQVDRCKPILGLDAFDHVPVHQHLEREPVQGPVQDSQIQDWSKTTAFLGYDEVRAVKPLPHLGWRDQPGGQQSPCARQEHSGLPPKSRECSWTWEVAWWTELCSRVELRTWANETGWAAQTTLPDAVQVAPTVQSAYPRWCSKGE